MSQMNVYIDDVHWSAKGACSQVTPDELFVTGAAQRDARSVCTDCPVQLQCLAEALDSRLQFGVWGGMTERERRAILRRYPEIDSWSDYLVTTGRPPTLTKVKKPAEDH